MLSPEQIEVLADAAVSAFFRLDTLARSKAAKALSDPIRVDSQAIIQAIMRSGAESREDISRVITATLSDAARTALSADEAAYAAARNAGLVAPYAALADSAAIQRLLESGI
ncbi:MAG: hypothetical protein U1E29_05535, partial [Coriobacteriia bacterium]|nr:hypothetical protein [Coriobacteriia bacterium]